MTDEEMAEQFADNINGLDLTCSLLSAKDKRHAYRLGRYDGFLAGLKAGRPQWHDLRKDPKDLPEAHWKNWVIAVYDGGVLWCRARREKCVDGVYWVNSYHHIIENVVMWAKIEIPTFDKE